MSEQARTPESEETTHEEAVSGTSTQAADDDLEADRPTSQTANGEQSENGRAAIQTAIAGASGGSESLIAEGEVSSYRGRWDSIQANFVDDPKGRSRRPTTSSVR